MNRYVFYYNVNLFGTRFDAPLAVDFKKIFNTFFGPDRVIFIPTTQDSYIEILPD